MACRNPVRDLFPDGGKGSPPCNFLQPLVLGSWPEEEARELLAHPWAPAVPAFDRLRPGGELRLASMVLVASKDVDPPPGGRCELPLARRRRIRLKGGGSSPYVGTTHPRLCDPRAEPWSWRCGFETRARLAQVGRLWGRCRSGLGTAGGSPPSARDPRRPMLPKQPEHGALNRGGERGLTGCVGGLTASTPATDWQGR